MRRAFVIVLLLIPACGGGDGGGASVTMAAGQQFEPASLTVKPGAIVTFSSESPESHTVTAYDGSFPDGGDYFSSGGAPSEAEARANVADALLNEGDSYEVTLTRPGTYRYFCIPHESQGMKGTITVTE